MTKPNLAEATKQINLKSTEILEDAGRVRKGLDALLSRLKEKETVFKRQKEEEKNQKRLEEQKILASQQTKAWTMPDEDEAPAEHESAPQQSAKEEADVKAEQTAESAPKPAAEKTEAPVAAAAAVAAETKEPAAPKTEAAPESKAGDEVKEPSVPQAQEAKPAAAKAQPVQDAPRAPSSRPQAPQRPAAQGTPGGYARTPAQGGAGRTPAQGGAGRAPAQGTPGAYNRAPGQGGPGAYNRAPGQGGPGAYNRAPGQGGPGAYNRAPGQGGPGAYNRAPGQGGPGGYNRAPGQGGQGAYNRAPGQGGPGGYNRAPGQGGPGGYNRAQGQGGQGGFGRPQGPAGGRPGAGRPGQGYGSRSKGPDLAPPVEKERVSNYDPNKKNYIRQHDPERGGKNRKQLERETFIDYDDDNVRGGKRGKKKPSAQQMMAPIKIETAYMTAETITVKDLTERIGKPAGEILKKLLMLGIISNINSELDFDTASLVCSEFGVTLEKKLDKTAEDALTETIVEDKEEDLKPRPPVITIMGHVDHGKTSLLDYIRKSHVTAGEAGGITQHIGAYTVELDGRVITFLDTPGHEAFTAMRMRGAQATDIAVLVVAADDGVMPQTVEAINHAKAAGVPIVVAINKMDKPGANPDQVKQELTKYDLVAEEWGGETIMAPVSAVTGQGVDELLELILLQADMLQLRANPDRMATGVIIEAKLDKAKGPLATVLLKNGTLHVGDSIIAGLAGGRVRAMTNDRGERVTSAGPSMPVEISGFDEVPVAGDEMMAVEDDKLTRQVVDERREKLKASRTATSKVSLDNLFANINEGKSQTLNLIIKADVTGSVEAVKQAMEKLSNDQVKIKILHSAAGAITQDDVNLAATFGATIIGFNIRPDSQARDAAEKQEVEIRLYRIIYQAIEDIEKAMKGMLEPVLKETVLGHAEVRNTFRITGVGTIAGCYVTDGKMQRNASVRLLRDNVVVFEGKLSSLRRFKDDVKEANQGYECGIGLENYNDIKEGDIIECFIMEEVTDD
ncbi:MAG: translation initiation factor IF-2 [Clostridia bacterium]|nr:translation initiation factor IF-2 [Clostridia bacterium]